MSGGLKNDAKVISYTCSDAVTYPGMVVTYDTDAREVKLCGASDHPIGYTAKDTKDAITGTATADKYVGIVGIDNGDIATLRVSATNAAIAIGDAICCVGDGLVDKRDGSTNTGDILGFAEEAVSKNTGGAMDVRIAYNQQVDVAIIADDAVDNDMLAPTAGKWSVVTLSAAGDADAILGSFENPESTAIIVDRVLLRITTGSTTAGGELIDIGAAADATTGSDTLIDGIASTTPGIFDNLNDTTNGINGATARVLDENGGTTSFITIQGKVAATAGLAAKVYIHYVGVGA